MAIEYIKDMNALLEIVENNEIVSFPYGAEGVTFLEFLSRTARLQSVVCVTQRAASDANKFTLDVPVVQLANIPYLKKTATIILFLHLIKQKFLM